ncbi:MAG: DUF2993 domain-containing protein [Gordonia sp. (in: high G+C Gram-positive bacteria)]|uniref:LmeA family phospholipid-binding protein n=1 Tax=Gordonia sp. (in: high G+C Gram-positive bacteria) TaxID=84139 RepID=UPI0039E2DE43
MTVDTVRAGRSEHRLATALETSPRVASEPEVTLGGFPYFRHAQDGRFPGLTITARGIRAAGPPDLRGVPTTCDTTPCWAELGVRADEVRGLADWRSRAPLTMRRVTASAKLDSVNLGRMLDITDLSVNTPAPADRAGGGGPGDGLLERSSGVLLTGTVTVPPMRPNPRTDGLYPPSAKDRFIVKPDTGQPVRVSVVVDLSVVDGQLNIAATDFYRGPEEHARGEVPPEIRQAVLQRFSGRVPYPRLPWGVVPTIANSAGSDVLISGKAAVLTATPDQF